MAEIRHPIQVVSRLTGLSPHVIRVWEKRYQAVTPVRTATNRRVYREEDIERLRLLASATLAGHQIGMIAQLPVEDLRHLIHRLGPVSEAPEDPVHEVAGASDRLAALPREETRPRVSRLAHSRDPGTRESESRPSELLLRDAPASAAKSSGSPESGVEAAVLDRLSQQAAGAVARFDTDSLLQTLEQGVVEFGQNGVLHRVICPLARRLGDLWKRGEITAAHEHFASAIIRNFLAGMAQPFGTADGAPIAIVTTPAGQLHELGAVVVSAAATNLGWRTIYLGSSLPASDIAGAAIQNRARAVLLSIVYPADDRQLPRELTLLRRYLPPTTEIVVGGRAARAYASTLQEIRAITPGDLDELGDFLDEIRVHRPEE